MTENNRAHDPSPVRIVDSNGWVTVPIYSQFPTGLSGGGNLRVCISESLVDLGAVDQGAAGVHPWLVDGSGVTQPVSAAALPLPAGASTETTLLAAKNDLDSISGKTPPLGQNTMAGSVPVVLASNQPPFHVVVDSMPAGGSSVTANQGTAGATAWPVDGSGVTQPVSVGSLPLPSGAAQEHATAVSPHAARLSDGASFYVGCKAGQIPTALGQTAMSGSLAVCIASDQSSIPVAATCSGTVTANQGSAGATAWKVDGSGVTQPVSASALPLPSGAATSSLQTTGNSSLSSIDGKVTACNTGAVTVAAITPPTLTKGTQGSTGFSTQDLKDAGRVLKTYTVSGLATVTSEALISLTPYADLVAGGAASTFTVTSGKRLRIQKITVTVRCTSTASVGGIVRLRLLAGTVLVSSPVHDSIGCMGSDLATAVIGNAQSFALIFPDGLELSGSMQFGLTQLFSATSATIDVHVTGYEY